MASEPILTKSVRNEIIEHMSTEVFFDPPIPFFRGPVPWPVPHCDVPQPDQSWVNRYEVMSGGYRITFNMVAAYDPLRLEWVRG